MGQGAGHEICPPIGRNVECRHLPGFTCPKESETEGRKPPLLFRIRVWKLETFHTLYAVIQTSTPLIAKSGLPDNVTGCCTLALQHGTSIKPKRLLLSCSSATHAAIIKHMHQSQNDLRVGHTSVIYSGLPDLVALDRRPVEQGN